MRRLVKPFRRPTGIDQHQAVPGLHALEPGLRRLCRRPALGLRARQHEVDENAVFLDRIIEQRQLAVAVPEKTQHWRHAVDRLL
jgi:hypothetical protein